MNFPDHLLNVPVAFGLRAQGHIPTIKHMLSLGKTWDEIGAAINWDPETARAFYARENHDLES